MEIEDNAFFASKKVPEHLKIVLVDGGLGNQLFQLAFARYIADAIGGEVNIGFHSMTQGYQHGCDGLADLAEALRLPIYPEKLSPMLTTPALGLRALRTRKIFSTGDWKRPSVRFGGFYIYSGYWQNHIALKKSYSLVADACCEIFSLRPMGTSCIHVRLGNYNDNANRKIYSQVGLSYYEGALSYLRQCSKVRKFTVVTNDLKGSHGIFKSDAFRELDLEFQRGKILDDFTTICGSETIVASNSTFCWWGAFISAHLGGLQRLVAPSEWFNKGFSHRQSPDFRLIEEIAQAPLDFASL